MAKGSDGRNDCEICNNLTVDEPVFLFFDKKRDPGDRVHRGHLKCLLNNPAVAAILVQDWDLDKSKERKRDENSGS